MEDNKNEMSITEAIERCDIMLNAISINGAEKGFANDDNGFPDFVVMKSLIRRCKWALKRHIPMKPDFTEYKEFTLCPCCNGKGLLDKQKYCDNCGQKLDWGDNNEID